METASKKISREIFDDRDPSIGTKRPQLGSPIFSLVRTVPGYQLLFRELLRGMHSQKTRQTAEDPGPKRERTTLGEEDRVRKRKRKTRRSRKSRRQRRTRKGGRPCGGECDEDTQRGGEKGRRSSSLTPVYKGLKRGRKARAPKVSWKRMRRVLGSLPREEWGWTRACKQERVRRGNRWMGLAAYPANAPSDIAVTSTWRERGCTVLRTNVPLCCEEFPCDPSDNTSLIPR